MAAKKTKSVNKTKYVKSLPPTMPAKEVVEKAKADGLTLTTNYVYTIRNKASKAAGAPAVAKKRGRPVGSVNKSKLGAAPASNGVAHAVASLPSVSSTKSHEGELYRLIERIVESKVREVLTARFGALLK